MNSRFASLLLLVAAILPTRAATPVLEALTVFGGPGDQRGTGIAFQGGHLYISGVQAANEQDSFAARLPTAFTAQTPPAWSFAWPALNGSDDFQSVSAGPDGAYFVGSSFARTADNVGGKENKGLAVKFPLDGATGPGYLGAIWERQAPPIGAFPYAGGEAAWGSATSLENGQTFLYVTGSAQVNGANGGRLFVSKFDAAGAHIWTRDDSADMVNNAYSIGRGLSFVDGFLYVCGSNADNGTKAYLRKYSPAGDLIWSRANSTGSYVAVAGGGGVIYVVGSVGLQDSTDSLSEKWTDSGDFLWSKTYSYLGSSMTGVVLVSNRVFASANGPTQGGQGVDPNMEAWALEISRSTGDPIVFASLAGQSRDLANGLATDGTSLFLVGETSSYEFSGNGPGENDVFVARFSIPGNIPAEPADLSIGIYAGLTITGTIGASYTIQAKNPSDPNWTTLETITLPASPYFWVDRQQPLLPNRIYQAIGNSP